MKCIDPTIIPIARWTLFLLSLDSDANKRRDSLLAPGIEGFRVTFDPIKGTKFNNAIVKNETPLADIFQRYPQQTSILARMLFEKRRRVLPEMSLHNLLRLSRSHFGSGQSSREIVLHFCRPKICCAIVCFISYSTQRKEDIPLDTITLSSHFGVITHSIGNHNGCSGCKSFLV